MNKQTLIDHLNSDLAGELGAIIQYLTYAAKATGPYRPQLAQFFLTEVADEQLHAQFLANKIVSLGGEPVTMPRPVPAARTNHEMLGASIVTPDDWKKVKAERFQLDHPARKVNIAALKQAHPADRDYPLGVWVGSMIGKIRDMLTLEGLAYAVHDYPLMVEDMVETSCQLVEQFLDQVLPHFNFDYAGGWEDICYRGGPLVSVKFFNRVVVPRYERIHQKLAAHGIDIWWIDCDGDVRPILPGMMKGGINCLFPFEVNSCTHPAELLREYGRDLRIMGGFDKMALGAGPDAIKAYMQTLVPLVERGGYIPFCDHRCPPNVKPEDYLYYLDLKEEMFGLGSGAATVSAGPLRVSPGYSPVG